MESPSPDYSDIAFALDKLATEVVPGEVHGVVCGLLCANAAAAAETWIQSLWPHLPQGDLLVGEALEVFRQLHEATRRHLNDPGCEFRLLLPDDDIGLDARVHALGDWCQGFLVGLSLGGITDLSPLPADAREIAEDLVEIARAGTSYQLEGSEEDEHAYAELMEYLRVGVLLINEELQPTKAPPLSDETRH
jgi:uncharacterized protein YgfB (UPF0149 family)